MKKVTVYWHLKYGTHYPEEGELGKEGNLVPRDGASRVTPIPQYLEEGTRTLKTETRGQGGGRPMYHMADSRLYGRICSGTIYTSDSGSSICTSDSGSSIYTSDSGRYQQFKAIP